MTFGFSGITDEARIALQESGVSVVIHRAPYTDVVTMVDIHAPEDTKVLIEADRTMYLYLINGIVYYKVDGELAKVLNPRLPTGHLFIVDKDLQSDFKSRIETYYQNHPPFRDHQF